MPHKNHFYKPSNFWHSFKIALKGLKLIFINESNFRIQILAAVAAIVFGILVQFTHSEWIAISFFITLVLISEAFNSVIEAICDCISQDYRETIKYAKDVSAGAVLLSSLASVIGGIIIVFPYLQKFIEKYFS